LTVTFSLSEETLAISLMNFYCFVVRISFSFVETCILHCICMCIQGQCHVGVDWHRWLAQGRRWCCG